MAAEILQTANSKIVYYEFNTYFQPVDIGEVIDFKYDDIVCKGLISDIDLDLSIGAPMKLKIRKV
jgi:hypothetical protein